MYTSVTEIGDAENIPKSYVSRILRLALLAPDIVEAVLDRRLPEGSRVADMAHLLPSAWLEQRRHLQKRLARREAGSS